jgi:NAD(P)-dependent dehydrogenase (short-subunit alcohol dehydrogenase family)
VVPDHVVGADVEEQGAARATPVALVDVDAQPGEGPPVGELLELEGDRVDVMYNNAGVSGVPRRFLADTLADFDRVIGVSLLGAMLGSQAAARRMVEQGTGGAIVNTASLAGITPGAGVMSYRVAKAGVIHFTRCLALELAEHGIRANVVAPANIATAINAGFDMGRTIEMTQPLARHGTPDDVAEAVLYLASDRARQTTGVVLPVDGGTSVGIPVARMAEIMRPRDTGTDS